MAQSVTMTNKQRVAAGITLVDEDGQPYASASDAGVTVTFSSSDPTVADFEVGADGMNGFVTSGKVGSAVITAATSGDTPKTDTLNVTVKNSAPGSLNFTVGEPEDEPE